MTSTHTPREPRPRLPLHIRLTARWAIVSLVIALTSMALVPLQTPSWITVALKIVVSSAGAVGAAALLLCAIFAGLHLAFRRRNHDTLGSPRDVS